MEMDKEALNLVMGWMSKKIKDNDDQIRENEDEIQVLTSTIEMAKQLKEKGALDETIVKRRAELDEIEDRMEKRYKDEKIQTDAIKKTLEEQTVRVKSANAEADSKVEVCRLKCNSMIEDKKTKAAEKIAVFATEEEEAFVKKNEVVKQHDQAVSKWEAYKLEVANR